METTDEFFAEVRRITTCPYTPNLKKLHICVQKTDVKVLQRWVRDSPCQIDSVAAVILEGLELWPFAVDLLRILSLIPAFRDAALQRKPLLLHTFLAKAVESDAGFEKFAPACISMLSATLTVAIPSNVPMFLGRLLEKTVKSKSPEDIRSVHRTLSGLGSTFLEDLSLDILARFQNHLADLLTTLDINDPFANLLCLAVLAKFASRPCDAPIRLSLTSQSLPLSNGVVAVNAVDTFCPARKYFVGKRAPKTFDLTVLKVINACSRISTLSPSEALETLALSEEIIDTLSSDDRRSRIDKNGGMIRNLYGKILRPDIDPGLQSAALNFATAVFNGQGLPGELKPLFERALSASASGSLTSRTLTMCTASFGPTVISESFPGLLRLACTSRTPDSDALANFDNALQMISTITAIIPRDSDLQHDVLEELTKGDNLAVLQQIVTQEPLGFDLNHGHGPENICPATYKETRMRLHQRLAVMILNVGLRSPRYNPDFSDVLAALVEKQAKLLNTSFRCMEAPPAKQGPEKSSLSLFEAGSTPQTQTVSHNWRENIVRELSRDVNRQHESVIRMVGELCRDLELRCDEAERPYRDEQCRSRDLQACLDDSQAKVTELEVRIESQRSELAELRSVRDCFSAQVQTSEEGLQEMGRRLDQMHREFDQAKSDNMRAAQAAQERSRKQDLDYMSILTGKDVALEEQANKLAISDDRIQKLEDELAQQKSRALQDAQTIICNEGQVQGLKNNVTTASELAELRLVDIERLKASEAHLIESTESIAKAAKEEAKGLLALISEQAAQLQAEKGKLEELKHEYERYTGSKDAEIETLEDLHRSSREKLEADLEEARNNAATAHKENTSQITNLKKIVKQLRKEREERAQEVAEARTMKTGFMAFMGKINDQPAPASKLPQASTHAIHTDSREQRSPDPAASFSSSTSSASRSGPTPKRTKRHRTPPHTQTAKATKSDVSFKTVRRSPFKSSRMPLADVCNAPSSSNPTSTQGIHWSKPPCNESAGGEALQENKEVHEWYSDDESFGGGDIFTSTDQRQLSALRSRTQRLPRDSFDETTTDF